jgi:hypothetical protein
MRYMNSPQHDSEDWMPVMMEARQALTISPQEFQANLDGGTPIILIGQPDSIEFDIPMLFGLLNFQSKVEFIGERISFHFFLSINLVLDSDNPSSTEIALAMRAGDAVREMYDWETSRPLIITHATDATCFYQPIERYIRLFSHLYLLTLLQALEYSRCSTGGFPFKRLPCSCPKLARASDLSHRLRPSSHSGSKWRWD